MLQIFNFRIWGSFQDNAPPFGLRLLFRLPIFLTFFAMLGASAYAQTARFDQPSYAASFDQGRGQLQVGGPFVGIEFHHSRPFPSRISFYSPVANSIDLSTDYWKRDVSQPFRVILSVDRELRNLQNESFGYRGTPAGVVFSSENPRYAVDVSYQFGEELPIMAMRISVTNKDESPQKVELSVEMAASLHTSHAYTSLDSAWTSYQDEGQTFFADYESPEAGNARVFVLNKGEASDQVGTKANRGPLYQQNPVSSFSYRKTLAPGESINIIQLVGSCDRKDCEAILAKAGSAWQDDVTAYENRVSNYAQMEALFSVADTTLFQTMQWSKALLQADKHYIDGHVVPMPTPAQYNFFFTHDLLLTDLGAVMFDTERVKEDLKYILTLARGDSLLPHAYYWREDGFKTESTNPDNWNHLWLVIASASYLQHSGDRATLSEMLPMIRQSLRIMLENEQADLMYASRPDWWDIGNRYGARAYITTLTIRALQSYLYIDTELGTSDPKASNYARLAGRMNEQLVDKLWDDEAGYLLNMVDSVSVDRHYYSGSLLAAAFGQLDQVRMRTLLETARRELLDEQIGIRNAMPPDFHELTERYQFLEGEVGAPYKYMNGGVWPQGIAWYILGLIASDQPEAAAQALRDYLTLDGIRQSPNGQPAFFEYREANPDSPTYGQIDKTTFLWAGGWYLHVLYQLSGVRENAWNVSFEPRTPVAFENTAYDLMVGGQKSRVTWSGKGSTFKSITLDGMGAASAVLTAAVNRIELVRGHPESPYLARASARVTHVSYQKKEQKLTITARGVPGQDVQYAVYSPLPLRSIFVDGLEGIMDLSMIEEDIGLYLISFRTTFTSGTGTVSASF
ncbi:hypothetical protein HQ496_07675 [bacterium]|nr:hypothetical protein [bacterium]